MQSERNWQRRHTLGVGLLIVLIILLHGWAFPRQNAEWVPWCWALSALSVLGIVIVAGCGIHRRWAGALINEQNRISLSRLQVILWTAVLLPAITISLATRMSYTYVAAPTARTSGPAYDAQRAADTAQQAFRDALLLPADVSGPSPEKAKGAAAQLKIHLDSATQATASATAAARKATELALSGSPTGEQIQDALDAAAATRLAITATESAAALVPTSMPQVSPETVAALQTSVVNARAAIAQATLAVRGNEGITGIPPLLAAFSLTIPAELWALMAISVTSAVGSLTLIRQAKDQTPNPAAQAGAKEKMEKRDGEPDPQIQGTVLVRTTPGQARFSDLFEGEFVGNATYLDVSRVQNLLFTLFLVLAYAGILLALFQSKRLITGLPAIPAGMVVLLGISHAGYLAAKATPRAGEATAPAPPAGGGTAIGGGGGAGNAATVQLAQGANQPATVAIRTASHAAIPLSRKQLEKLLPAGADGTPASAQPIELLYNGNVIYRIDGPAT